jgi:polygalacturonase
VAKIFPYFFQRIVFLERILFFSQTIISASDFGVKPNSFENSSSGIRQAIEACKLKSNATLILPGGRIDIWPEEAVKRELYISNCIEDDTLSKVKNIVFFFEDCKKHNSRWQQYVSGAAWQDGFICHPQQCKYSDKEYKFRL